MKTAKTNFGPEETEEIIIGRSENTLRKRFLLQQALEFQIRVIYYFK